MKAGAMKDRDMKAGAMKDRDMKARTAVIIGGGMGGLITGAMLSRSGWRVTVLEKNWNVGGGLQTFRRGGTEFSPGMHLVGGSDGGAAAALLRSFGVDVRIEPCDMALVMPEGDSTAGSGGNAGEAGEYRLPQGVEAFVKFFAGRFPDSRGELERYVARMQEICDAFPLFRLFGEGGPSSRYECGEGQSAHERDKARPASEYETEQPVIEGDALMPADEFIAKYISDFRLRKLLGWLNPLSGVIPGVTPAYVHAIINILYISGSGRLVGGAKGIAGQLAGIIEESGGSVRAGCTALELIVGRDSPGGMSGKERGISSALSVGGMGSGGRKVTGVRASDGNVYEADIYVSGIHPSVLVSLCPPDAFPKAFRRRIAAQKPGISMFSLYIKLKPDAAESGYCADGTASPNLTASPGGTASPNLTASPDGICPPEVSADVRFIMDGDSFSASRPWGEILCFREGDALTLMTPMSCGEVARWKGTASGNRPEEYKEWVSERTEQLLERVERLEPGFRSRIEGCWPASPLTLGKYLGDPDGAAYGFRIDSSAPSYSRFGPKTYIRNLYMTGQNVFLHGLCGVSMAAVMTAEAIAGDLKQSQMKSGGENPN